MAVRKDKLVMSLPYTILGFVALCFVLSGCEKIVYHETNVTEKRVRVEQTQFDERYKVSELNEGMIVGIGHKYNKHGDGTLDLTITYDAHSHSANAMHASDVAAKVSQGLRKAGVRDVRSNIVPVKGGAEMEALISFSAYNALEPDCEPMPGYNTRTIEAEADYELGCTQETIFAKQIARPKDLKGNSFDPNADGRRMANTVEVYRTGEPNEVLGGESATGE